MSAQPASDGLPGWLTPLADAVAGLRGEDLSRFLPPEDGSGRHSAVLIVVGCVGDASVGSVGGSTTNGADEPGVLLIERSHQLRSHAGQVAFPGGSVDPDDADEVAAALREADEEVGLRGESVHVFAELPAVYIPVTRFVVHPVLAWWREPHPVSPHDPGEVARAVVVPLAALADPANRFTVQHPSGLVGPGFAVADLFVWGFTAGLLDRLLEFGGWALPWDRDRRAPLPDRLSGRPPARPGS